MISAIAETIWRQQRIRQVLLASTIFDPCLSRFDGSWRLISVACFEIDSCAPAHLKLVCFPAHSPLPTAALPSMSLSPKAPLKLAPCPTRSLLPSQFYLLCRFSQKLHSTSRFCPSMSLASPQLH